MKPARWHTTTGSPARVYGRALEAGDNIRQGDVYGFEGWKYTSLRDVPYDEFNLGAIYIRPVKAPPTPTVRELRALAETVVDKRIPVGRRGFLKSLYSKLVGKP